METAAELHDLLDKILSTDIEFFTAPEASAWAGKIEQASRKLDAIAVALVDVVDRNGLYADDVPHHACRGEPTRRAREHVPQPR
jgi:hypothetical protein